MQENKFEDQVRGIMDHLTFDPDEKVWENVGKKIDEDKKRRRPIFWIFLLTGGLIAGSGYFLLINYASKSLTTSQTDLLSPASSMPLPADPHTAPVPNAENKSGQKTTALSMSDADHRQNQKNTYKKPSPVSSKARTENPDDANTGINGNSGSGTSDASGVNTVSAQPALAESNGNPVSHQGSVLAPVPAFKQDHSEMQDHPVQAQTEKSTLPVAKQESESKKSTDRKFSFGIFASPGIPVIHSAYSGSYYANAPATSGGSGNSSVPPPSNPDIKSGFTWSIGAFASKKLSPKISLSAGLNYRYVSTQSEISSPTAAYSTVYYAAAAARNFPSTTYTNQYHYIGIPLWVDFTLNRNPDMPLIWEAGLAFDWLAGTNALYYDPTSGVYYKNSSKINHTLWSASTAFLIGFSKGRFQAGPQLQYGLNSIVQPPSASQNLISWNLKLAWNFR